LPHSLNGTGRRDGFCNGILGGNVTAASTASGAGLDIVRQLQANCERPFSDARSMPPAVYTSPDFLALEQERIFRREWLCVGRASALAKRATISRRISTVSRSSSCATSTWN
jgi:hypothetical protein